MIAISIHQHITISHNHFSVYTKHMCELTCGRSGSRRRQSSRRQTWTWSWSLTPHTGSRGDRFSWCWIPLAASPSLLRGPNCELQSWHYRCRWRNQRHFPKESPNAWNIFIFVVMIKIWKHTTLKKVFAINYDIIRVLQTKLSPVTLPVELK